MPKNRIFKITDGTETKEVEAMSFKKAVRSFQGSSKAKMITIEWMTKGGELFVKDQKIPMGRKKKIGRQTSSESEQESVSKNAGKTQNGLC